MFNKMKTINTIQPIIIHLRLSPKTFPPSSVSLNEALGLAGDLTIYGRRDNVLLIREIDGQKK